MKKSLLLIMMAVLAISTFAQRNNIDPKIQAERDMKAIENKMLKAGTDEEGIKLIKAHNGAKRKMDATMRQMPGYGKAATDKAAIAKFREKNAKKDNAFNELSQNEKNTRKAKEDYIANSNEQYKSLMQKAAN